MSKGKTYEIICRRGNNRIECPFKKQDPDLHCAECSYAMYRLRTIVKQKTDESQQSDIPQQN